MKGKKLVAAGVIVVALLGALTLWLLYSPAESSPTLTAANSLTIHSAEVSSIQTLVIHNQYGDFTITAKDGGFTVGDIPPMLVDYAKFAAMMNSCANLTAISKVENPASLSEYGLDAPDATAALTFAGEQLAFSIGAKEPVSGGYYCKVEGRPDIYVLDGKLGEFFLQEAKTFIELRATPPLVATSPLSVVQQAVFTGGVLEEPLVIQFAAASPVLQQKALSFGAVTHLISRQDDYYEMDQTYGVTVLGSLLGIPAHEVVAYNCTPQQLTEYGFDTPWMTAQFTLQSAPESPVEEYLLQLVQVEANQYLLTVNDYGIVYRVGLLPFMEIDREKLVLRWYLSPMLQDITGLTVTTGAKQLDFELSGEKASELSVLLGGQPVDVEAFRQFYKLAVSAANDGQPITQPNPEGQPLLRLEYRYKNTDKTPDVLELYPGGNRKLLVVVNGNPLPYGMREMYLTRMLAACDALPEGTPFDGNW